MRPHTHTLCVHTPHGCPPPLRAQALFAAAQFDPVRREVTAQRALVTLMALVLEEEHSRALMGLRVLNACVQVRGVCAHSRVCVCVQAGARPPACVQGLGCIGLVRQWHAHAHAHTRTHTAHTRRCGTTATHWSS